MRRRLTASCLLFLAAPAGAAPDSRHRDLEQAERAQAAQRAASLEGAERARAAEAEVSRLADASIEAADRLRATEQDIADAAGRVEALAERRAAAERRLAERSAALGPALPLIQRLSLHPAETLLAAPAPTDAALRGLLVLRGLGIGSSMMPSMAAAYASLERAAVPRATSALNVVQRVGGSLGTALLAVILQGQIKDQLGGAGRVVARLVHDGPVPAAGVVAETVTGGVVAHAAPRQLDRERDRLSPRGIEGGPALDDRELSGRLSLDGIGAARRERSHRRQRGAVGGLQGGAHDAPRRGSAR